MSGNGSVWTSRSVSICWVVKVRSQADIASEDQTQVSSAPSRLR